MRALRLFGLFILTFALLLAVVALLRPGGRCSASVIEHITNPQAAAALESQCLDNALTIATQRTAANTVRLGFVLTALVLLAVIGAAVALVRATRPASTYWPETPVRVLGPNDPEFRALLREAGGYYVNGRPLLDEREVEALEVEER